MRLVSGLQRRTAPTSPILHHRLHAAQHLETDVLAFIIAVQPQNNVITTLELRSCCVHVGAHSAKMADHSTTGFLVDRLGREQIQAVRLLPVLVLRGKVQIEHMTHHRGDLLRQA